MQSHPTRTRTACIAGNSITYLTLRVSKRGYMHARNVVEMAGDSHLPYLSPADSSGVSGPFQLNIAPVDRPAHTSHTMENKRKLRVGFVHPDLGIGGAERLVVDAAVSLQKLEHEVFVFTSRHDPSRCFEETRDGTLSVHVLGSSLPQRLPSPLPAMTILFSLLRSILLSCLLISSTWMPGPASFVNPLSPLGHFDIFFVDQQSVCVPFLRFFLGTRVVFYCHFPDKLLSGGWEVAMDKSGEENVQVGVKGRGLLRRIYRWPVDTVEEWTTGQSDVILSNSNFTSRVYARSFPSLAKRKPKVVYPCIDVSAYRTDRKGKGKAKADDDKGVTLISSERPTLISLNRYEAKKNIHLAIRSFAEVLDTSPELRLVIAGGYDNSLQDNLHTLWSLRSLAESLNLTHHTLSSSDSAPPDSRVQVLFVLNFSTAQRSNLLTHSSTIALLYTPANEHFGIVPVEAMACGLPVIAADSGGPTESIIDLDISFSSGHVTIGNEGGTGLLRSPAVAEWAPAIRALLALSSSQRQHIRQAGIDRVAAHFSSETLGKEVEQACHDALTLGDLHGHMGDKLIWGGAGLMGFAALNLAAILLWYGFPAVPV